MAVKKGNEPRGKRVLSAPRLSWRLLPWPVEIVSITVGYGLYAVTRVLVLAPNHTRAAYAHAVAMIRFERVAGIYHEVSLNQYITGRSWLEVPASYYYATLHFLVTPLVLAWLWRKQKLIFAAWRSALVIATIAALLVYAGWPLAPPRYASAGAVDTVSQHPILGFGSGHGASGLINELAAMPSLHVGWAVWCAAALVASLTSRWRHLFWLYPVLTTVVAVATANHYLSDAVVGTAMIVAALGLCGVRPRRDLAASTAQAERPAGDAARDDQSRVS